MIIWSKTIIQTIHTWLNHVGDSLEAKVFLCEEMFYDQREQSLR